MRVPTALHLAAWLVLVSGSLARAQSAGEMLRACEILQRGMHVEGGTVYLPPGGDVHQCLGFMSAVLEYSTLADRDGKTLLNSCPRPDTTAIQRTAILLQPAEKDIREQAPRLQAPCRAS
jgi:hypothetical protein